MVLLTTPYSTFLSSLTTKNIYKKEQENETNNACRFTNGSLRSSA